MLYTEFKDKMGKLGPFLCLFITITIQLVIIGWEMAILGILGPAKTLKTSFNGRKPDFLQKNDGFL